MRAGPSLAGFPAHSGQGGDLFVEEALTARRAGVVFTWGPKVKAKIYGTRLQSQNAFQIFAIPARRIIRCKSRRGARKSGFSRGLSSVGRAPQWHCGGQGFESPRLQTCWPLRRHEDGRAVG